jgi:hypothetical protein
MRTLPRRTFSIGFTLLLALALIKAEAGAVAART